MAFDPKKKKDSATDKSEPKPADTNTKKDESSGSNGMGGMIGEGRADEGSRGGMKGEQ